MAVLLPWQRPATPPFMTMPDDARPGSPMWWVYRLAHQIQRETLGPIVRKGDGTLVQRVGLSRLERYYDGEFDLPWVPDSEVRREFLAMLERSRSNFMRLVVNVPAERMVVQGLRFPNGNEASDEETWDIWLRSDMDAQSQLAFAASLIYGRSYLSVWWNGANTARISVEDPQQAYVEYVPGSRTQRAAGIKTYIDDWTGEAHATLMLPTEVYYFRFGRPPGGNGPEGWFERAERQPNRLGVVPMVPVVNMPRMHRNGVSHIEDVIPSQDRICQTLWNRQVAEHLTAFRQKWGVGIDIPVDPETGEAVQPYKAALDTLWVSPDPATKFGQFDATDLTNYHKTIEQDLEHISIISRTPRHVFMHQGQAPSGDAMKSDEAGQVAMVRGFQRSASPALREALSLARRIEGDDTPLLAEVVWGDPEFQTFGQLVDGHSKLVQNGISSRRYAREKVGMTPATIRRVEAEIAAEQLTSFLTVDDFTPPADDG